MISAFWIFVYFSAWGLAESRPYETQQDCERAREKVSVRILMNDRPATPIDQMAYVSPCRHVIVKEGEHG